MNDQSFEPGPASGPQSPPDVEMQLIIEEYKSTRSILGKNIDIMERTEILSIGAVGSAIAFSISQKGSGLFIYSAIIPLFVTILGYMRFIALDQTIAIYNAYLLQYECCYRRLGLTKFFQDSRDRIKGDNLWGWSLLSSRIFTLGVLTASAVFYLIANLCGKKGDLTHLNWLDWGGSIVGAIFASVALACLHYKMLKSAKSLILTAARTS